MIAVDFESVTSQQWDDLVRSSPDGWPFALTNWRKVILSVQEWQLQDHSFALAENGQLSAVVPLQLDTRSGVLGMTGWGGCGPIVAAGLEGSARDAVIGSAMTTVEGIAEQTGARSLRFSIPPVTQSAIENVQGVNSLAYHGLQGLQDLSGIAQVIDLSVDEPVLWRGLSETARQTVRKAEKAGVAVRRADWSSAVDDYYRVHIENYRRTGVEPHPKTYFAGIAREMGSGGYSVLWVARTAGGQPIAFHNDMHFGSGAWYHTGCSLAAALDNGANYLLFWHAMMGAKAAGHRWYDCGEIFPQGGNTKQNGLTLFKTRFGGRPHRFLKAGRDYAPTSKQGFDTNYPGLLKRLVRRLRNSFKSHDGKHER